MPESPRSRFLNYLGQLRLYSFSDLLLLLLAVRAGAPHLIGISLLWFGFLIQLEWRHRDRGRHRWPWYAWIVPWAAGIALIHSPVVLGFFLLSVAYALKKALPSLAAVSPLTNGLLKGALVACVPGVPPSTLVLVVVAMALRNLAGDLRDTEKDFREGVRTLPVRAGVRSDVPGVYPAALVATSVLWTVLGALPIAWLVTALVVQAFTYRLTPR